MYAAIVALSLLAHLKGITAPVLDYHYHRQANTASIARNYHRFDLPPWSPRIDWEGGTTERAATELPVYMWLVGLLWTIFELGDVWGRLVSVICSALTAVLLFRFLERDDEAKTGWLATPAACLAALSFSVLPVEVYFGRTIQPEAMALMATVASFWAMDRFLASSGRKAFGWWAATVAAATIAIGQKLPYAYLLGVLGFLGLARRGRGAVLDPRIWAVPLATVALVYGWYRWASTGLYVVPRTGDASIYRSILSYERLPYFAFFQVASRLPELALTYPGILFAAAGARELIWRRKFWFLGAWWACVLSDVIAGGGYAHYHDYTALPWAPVNAAFIGAGLWALWKSPAWPLSRTVVVVLGLGMPLHAALRIHHWYNWTSPYLLSAKTAVDQVSGPDDLFLCNERASSLPLYLVDRRGWSWDVAELGPGGLERVSAVAKKGAKYFMTARVGIFEDPKPKDPVAKAFYQKYPVIHRDDNLLIFRLEPK